MLKTFKISHVSMSFCGQARGLTKHISMAGMKRKTTSKIKKFGVPPLAPIVWTSKTKRAPKDHQVQTLEQESLFDRESIKKDLQRQPLFEASIFLFNINLTGVF